MTSIYIFGQFLIWRHQLSVRIKLKRLQKIFFQLLKKEQKIWCTLGGLLISGKELRSAPEPYDGSNRS